MFMNFIYPFWRDANAFPSRIEVLELFFQFVILCILNGGKRDESGYSLSSIQVLGPGGVLERHSVHVKWDTVLKRKPSKIVSTF